MIYCPRCDKPITPDHRCLSRRHFFGSVAGLLACALSGKAIAAPATMALVPSSILRAGDAISISVTTTLELQLEKVRPALERLFHCVTLREQGGRETTYVTTGPSQVGDVLFVAPRDYTITGVRTVSSTGYVNSNATITIQRGAR